MAVKTDGTLWTWGGNGVGTLGLGNTTYYSSPKQVGALTNWSTVSCGNTTAMAIKTDGTLWGWGQNGYGNIGLGNTTNYSSPKQVGSLTNWSKVSCGFKGKFTIAVKTDGTLWSWGGGDYGVLGLGNSTFYSSPKQVGALTNWLDVSCGNYHTIAVKTDGTLWGWGLNSQGQLGLGNTTYLFNSPQQVGALTAWNKVNAGGTSSSSIKSNATLWTWGQNNNGQLGLNDTTGRSSPTQVGSLSNWSKMSFGLDTSQFALATKTDGTLWSWGYNNYGQLGLNTGSSYFSSPKQVGALSSWATIGTGFSFSFAIGQT
jgi:alpha-tubulin suppressor-like RCC1 family protein